MDNCDFNDYNIYNIPDISFIAGSRQEYIFHFYAQDGETPVPLNDVTNVRFRLSFYGNPNQVVFWVDAIKVNESPYNSARLVLDDYRTVSLHGKFVYQISLIKTSGQTLIPIQGILNIFKQFQEASEVNLLQAGGEDE